MVTVVESKIDLVTYGTVIILSNEDRWYQADCLSWRQHTHTHTRFQNHRHICLHERENLAWS